MQKKRSFLRIPVVQTLLAMLLCIVVGLLVGFLALLIINPNGAWEAIVTVLKGYLKYSEKLRPRYLGQTLVKTAPLLMCSLSVLFAYKAGLFNIGVAGQYTVGAGAAIYCALYLKMPWYVCMLAAIFTGAVFGALVGLLKAFCNVNEVISSIMINWISLYLVNMLLAVVKAPTGKDTMRIKTVSEALLPSLGLDGKNLFGSGSYVTLAVPLAVVIAIGIWVLLNKTKLGYELKATGMNRNAAKYCGMKEQVNIILTMAISGALAAMGAAMLYLSDFEQWAVTATSLPAMGFNGIAAAFLGGLNPIGAIFSSFFIQHITVGGSYVDKKMYCAQISDFISSIIIYLCAFVLFLKKMLNRKLDRRLEAKAAIAKEVSAK